MIKYTNKTINIPAGLNPNVRMSEYVTQGYVDEMDASVVGWVKSQEYATPDDLEAKQDTLVSGVNIKTINGQSILGPGNLDIQGGEGSVNDVKVNGESVVVDGVAEITIPEPQEIPVTDVTVNGESVVEDGIAKIDLSGYSKAETVVLKESEEPQDVSSIISIKGANSVDVYDDEGNMGSSMDSAGFWIFDESGNTRVTVDKDAVLFTNEDDTESLSIERTGMSYYKVGEEGFNWSYPEKSGTLAVLADIPEPQEIPVTDVTVNGVSVLDGTVADIKLKTINGEDITGEGNIEIQGGSDVPTLLINPFDLSEGTFPTGTLSYIDTDAFDAVWQAIKDGTPYEFLVRGGYSISGGHEESAVKPSVCVATGSTDDDKSISFFMIFTFTERAMVSLDLYRDGRISPYGTVTGIPSLSDLDAYLKKNSSDEQIVDSFLTFKKSIKVKSTIESTNTSGTYRASLNYWGLQHNPQEGGEYYAYFPKMTGHIVTSPDMDLALWKGTQAEYDALSSYSDSTVYIITE